MIKFIQYKSFLKFESLLKLNVMKKIILLVFTVAVFVFSSGAADYKEVMAGNIQKMYQARTLDELTGLANQFDRISQVEKTEWLPGYYAAYCYVSVLFFAELSNEDKQKYLDMAQANIDNILLRAKNESEIYTLQALIYQLRITDASLGYKFSTKSNEALAIAEKLNPENPRVYYLKGSNTFYTPKSFGGGPENAKLLLEKAAKMFASQTVENKLLPSWGSEHTNQLLSQCP
jgi:hypothetical protein